MTTPQVIDKPDDLDKLAGQLRGQEFIAVDTEFLRESTYYSRLCLIQVATPSTIACVDAIALDDLSPLTAVLLDTTITKVLHSARQDYEILLNLTGQAPAPVFDTQIAADLCGFGDQGGFAAIAAELLSVEIDKTHTRTDWSRRPLSAEQLRYALDDVRYLIPIYEALLRLLDKNGRSAWQAEECKKLIDPALYRVEPVHAWQRLGGMAALTDGQFHTARLLADWRETRAMALDRPRGWVIRDDVLMRIATNMPDSATALGDIEGLPRPLVRKESGTLLEIVAAGRSCDEPVPSIPGPLTNRQRKLVSRMMSAVRETAAELGISASTLATRRDVTAMVRNSPTAAPMHGWRRDIVGERLLAMRDENA